jgi:hypothetical protein
LDNKQVLVIIKERHMSGTPDEPVVTEPVVEKPPVEEAKEPEKATEEATEKASEDPKVA